MARIDIASVVYDRRPNCPRVRPVTPELMAELGGRLTYQSRSGRSGHYDVHLPYGVETWPHYRTCTHHVEGIVRCTGDLLAYIVVPEDPCHPVVRVSETGAELIWAHDFAFGFARPLDEQFGGDDVVDATIRLRVLGDDLEFGVRLPEWRQDMVRSLPLNLRVALARLSPEWSPEFDAFFDAESVAHKRFGIECAKNGGVYRCRSGVSTDIIRSYLQQDVEYAAEGSWERHLPDGCSDITEQVPHVPAGARVLVAAEGVLALQYTDGEWWDYHESLGTDDPSTAGARAVGGLTEKIAAQSAQRAVSAAT